MLDHKGIDLRHGSPVVRSLFDSVPAVATDRGWRHVGQGGGGTLVYCCHTEVEEKHWVYPVLDDARQSRPIEFAFGELVIHDAKMGCDLRPIDPAHPRAGEAAAALAACAATQRGRRRRAARGHRRQLLRAPDLGHFGDVGDFATPMMTKFWAYYNSVFGADGALTKREKALIGLAVAHSKQCPYCIDSFTGSCVDLGASPMQMHEAVHAAAALGAGIDLVHGVQMQNSLRRRGAIRHGSPPGTPGVRRARVRPMPLPPPLSPEARQKALDKAAAARRQRAELKDKLKMGSLSLKELIDQGENDEVVGKMKVLTVLESLPGVGKVRARRLMDEIRISEARRVRGLGAQQREALLKQFPSNT